MHRLIEDCLFFSFFLSLERYTSHCSSTWRLSHAVIIVLNLYYVVYIVNSNYFLPIIQQVKLFGSKVVSSTNVEGREVAIEGLATPGIVHKDGLLLKGKDGKQVRLSMGQVVLELQFTCFYNLIQQFCNICFVRNLGIKLTSVGWRLFLFPCFYLFIHLLFVLIIYLFILFYFHAILRCICVSLAWSHRHIWQVFCFPLFTYILKPWIFTSLLLLLSCYPFLPRIFVLSTMSFR